jgi:hypothetical protein
MGCPMGPAAYYIADSAPLNVRSVRAVKECSLVLDWETRLFIKVGEIIRPIFPWG